ncbi:hypothetical protein N1851_014548 [Merluccius polli]|uniref:Uncharacterized protein n=1 Tax=Merluccius polli TaxID=89951 RepID=A0AA47P399_MERPO|nr:hypothetical protein N1851_014548 [Merluccius polli]
MDEHYKKNESMSGKHQHHQRRHGKNVCQPKTGLSSPTVEEIVAEYPCFVDMPYLFDTEFGRMLPGKADVFNRKWEAIIVPNILKISTASEPSGLPPVPENDGRGKGYGKCSVKSALAYLLDIKPIGTSISSLLNPPERLVGYHQPHLVCIGQPNATAQYVIVAEKDKVAIPLEDYGLSFAIDKLFKMIWVCNAVYPAQLTSYRFCYC